MNEETKIEPYYQKEAQEFIDMLFDKGYFIEDITRKDMQNVEDLLAFLFQSKVNMAVRASEMLRSLNERQKEKDK